MTHVTFSEFDGSLWVLAIRTLHGLHLSKTGVRSLSLVLSVAQGLACLTIVVSEAIVAPMGKVGVHGGCAAQSYNFPNIQDGQPPTHYEFHSVTNSNKDVGV